MLIAMEDNDFAELIKGTPPRGLRLPDTAIAPPNVLEMLRALANSITADFAPAAWMMIEDEEIMGICSIVRAPTDRRIEIGYGVAPSRQGTGVTSRALGDLLAWARDDSRIDAVAAETGVSNLASQIVLMRNGFREIGQRQDAEDGRLICWLAPTVR